MKLGYFDGCRFFRMIPDFVTQFGLPSEPALAKQVRVRVRVRVRVQPSLAALPPSVRRKQCPSVEASSRARLTAPARPHACPSVRPSPSAISAGPSAAHARARCAVGGLVDPGRARQDVQQAVDDGLREGVNGLALHTGERLGDVRDPRLRAPPNLPPTDATPACGHRHPPAATLRAPPWQLFINLKDNGSMLDGQGFSPIGRVVGGRSVVEALHAQKDEGGPDQQRIKAEGSAYLNSNFPDLSVIKSAHVMACPHPDL